MSAIQIDRLSFTYPGSYAPVFSDVSFTLDSSWRLGLVGRNGRGKTTLLKLLCGQLQGRGQILTPLQFDYFPFPVEGDQPALSVLRDAVAPFDAWEQQMARLLQKGDEHSLFKWGDIEQAYSAADGYQINALIEREVNKLGIEPAALTRPFMSFSPGERTRLLLAALFLRKHRFLVIDEPTNHLDMAGRALVGEYLAGKQGFLLVSHDRAFLDRSVDHIMALQKNSVVITQGDYSSYRHNKQQQDDFERAQHARLTGDINRLKESSRQKAGWSDKVEASKIGQGVADRGYVGAKSAKMMKRSLAIQARIDRQIEEKEGLLKELEYTSPINLQPLRHPARQLMSLSEICFGYDEVDIISDLSLSLEQGERLAISGGNGSGKSTLLKLMLGELSPRSGRRGGPRDLIISSLPQEAGQLSGTPFELAQRLQLPTDHFLMLLRKFDFPREAFERDMRDYSQGQKKKLLLAASMARPAHLYLWDEPLNYIDVESREQIESMLAQTTATLVFVEHDRRFVDKVATRILTL